MNCARDEYIIGKSAVADEYGMNAARTSEQTRRGRVRRTNRQWRRSFVSKQNKLSSFNIISYIFIGSNIVVFVADCVPFASTSMGTTRRATLPTSNLSLGFSHFASMLGMCGGKVPQYVTIFCAALRVCPLRISVARNN